MSTSANFMESKNALNFEDPSIFHDRVLIVGGKKFYVVSGVLSMWSEFFRGLFSENFNESDKKEIELKDLDADIFEILLRSIYVTDIIPLIELSYRFLAPVVLQQCKEYINKNMDKMDDIMLKLLETACVYGIEGLKTKLVNHLRDGAVLNKFSTLEVLELAHEHKLDNLKNTTALHMSTSFTFQNCSDYLNCCAKFNLKEMKTTMIDKIENWKFDSIPKNMIIELTKSAFKHDVKNLKDKIRWNIYYMADKKYNICTVRGKNAGRVTSVFNINWYLEKYHEEIFTLPAEIMQFIVMSVCKSSL